MTQVTSKEYDEKLYQVKITIVNDKYVRQKGLKKLTAHRRDVGVANIYLMQL